MQLSMKLQRAKLKAKTLTNSQQPSSMILNKFKQVTLLVSQTVSGLSQTIIERIFKSMLTKLWKVRITLVLE